MMSRTSIIAFTGIVMAGCAAQSGWTLLWIHTVMRERNI